MDGDQTTFFDPWKHVDIHGTKLPHWQQAGKSYFVTFRLADSLPANRLYQWREERNNWLHHHPEPWSSEIEDEYHRRFSMIIDEWLDLGHGECVLRNPTCRDAIRTVLNHSDENRYLLHAWIAMPNHVHLLFTLASGERLEKLLNVWKGSSARKINSLLSRTGKSVWMKGYFDRIIRDSQHFRNVARYIRNNATKANLPDTEFSVYESAVARDVLSG